MGNMNKKTVTKPSTFRTIYKKCTSCDGDGYVSAAKFLEGKRYDYSFRCPENCTAARNNCPPDYRSWSVEFESEYTRVNIPGQEVNLEKHLAESK